MLSCLTSDFSVEKVLVLTYNSTDQKSCYDVLMSIRVRWLCSPQEACDTEHKEERVKEISIKGKPVLLSGVTWFIYLFAKFWAMQSTIIWRFEIIFSLMDVRAIILTFRVQAHWTNGFVGLCLYSMSLHFMGKIWFSKTKIRCWYNLLLSIRI